MFNRIGALKGRHMAQVEILKMVVSPFQGLCSQVLSHTQGDALGYGMSPLRGWHPGVLSHTQGDALGYDIAPLRGWYRGMLPTPEGLWHGAPSGLVPMGR